MSLNKKISFTFSTTSDNSPVAFLDNMPNCGTELSPSTLRDIAIALMKAADDCERIQSADNAVIPQQHTYEIGVPDISSFRESLSNAIRVVLKHNQASRNQVANT